MAAMMQAEDATESGSAVFSLTIIENSRPKVKNRLIRVNRTSTFHEIIQQFWPGDRRDEFENVSDIQVSCRGSPNVSPYHVELGEKVQTITDFDKSLSLNQVTYYLMDVELSDIDISDCNHGNNSDVGPDSSHSRDAFQVMMNASRSSFVSPEVVPVRNNKDDLHNQVVHSLKNAMVFPKHVDNVYHTRLLTNCLWYLDGRKTIIMDYIKNRAVVTMNLPERFKDGCFDGFQLWSRNKKKPRLEQSVLRIHAENLFVLLGKSWLKKWDPALVMDMENLAVLLQQVSDQLEKKSQDVKEHHSALNPARQISKDATVTPLVSTSQVQERYKRLNEKMRMQEDYCPVYVDPDLYMHNYTAMQRHRFREEMVLSAPVDMLRYDPGGGVDMIVFIWCRPAVRSETEIATQCAQMLQQLQPRLPEYHTRAMRSQFSMEMAQLDASLPAHIIRGIYQRLTLDATADQHPAIDERVRLAMSSNQPALIMDMRHLNRGRPGETFSQFFETASTMIEEWAAADDRRHGTAHFSQFISVPDLIKQVAAKLSENAPIPSESTVYLAFSPPNMCSHSARNYTGRLDLRHKVQTRQLRQYHPDSHYVSALWKYMRELAVSLGDMCLLISADDKAKVPVGEPNLPISTGVRGQRSIVPSSMKLEALDHDMQQKASLVPSVLLDIDIPDNISQSFYRGDVIIRLKESVFQPSNPNRFVSEVCQYWDTLSAERKDTVKTLMLFTDGGPEHKVTFESVKLSLMHLFQHTKVELLIAMRCAPGQSYTNPVERVMSIINLGLQNVALERHLASDGVEVALKTCQTVDSIRKKQDQVKAEWQESLTVVTETIAERLGRCSLKDKPFIIMKPSTDEDLDAVWATITGIDSGLEKGKLQQVHTKKRADYLKYKQEHCRERTYSFQIRKCSKEECCGGNLSGAVPDWLPDPILDATGAHYKAFSDVYTTSTTDDDRPSVLKSTRKVTEELQGIPSAELTGQHTRSTVRCTECHKPRCLYSKEALSVREERCLNRLMINYDFVCGCMAIPENHVLEGKVFSRLGLTCLSPLEWAYYSSKIGENDLCCQCGTESGEVDVQLLAKFKSVLPMCVACNEKSLKPLTRGSLSRKRKATE